MKKMAINREKGNKTVNEVNQVENISNHPDSSTRATPRVLQGKVMYSKKSLFHVNISVICLSNRILANYKKTNLESFKIGLHRPKNIRRI